MKNNSLDTAFRRLEFLDLGTIESSGDWGLGRTFSHLAQGVEFSITGYPEELPRLIQMTAGKFAFTLFKFRGRMSHTLDAEIPGELIADVTAADGVDRLCRALEEFRDHDGGRRPHYAYGPLAKDQFALAHLLHIEDHLQEVRGTDLIGI